MEQKNKKYSLKLISIVIIIITSIILLGTTSNSAQNSSVKALEVSKNYKYWANISQEAKENSIEPSTLNVNLKNSIKRSVYNNLLSGNITIESKYNLKDQLGSIIVKNQRKAGSCWAFAYSSMVETTIANKYNKISTQYSPMHMDYQSAKIYNRNVGEGGSFVMPIAYSASGKGPVYEQDFSFESVYDEKNNSAASYYLADINTVQLEQKPRAKVETTVYFANIYKTYLENSITYSDDSSDSESAKKYTEEEVNSNRTLIKKHIKENGAVMAKFYSDMGINASGDHISKGGYYNQNTTAFYCNDSTVESNHAVTIVGWDDNFKKENFNENKRPINDGAYIVLNSWGTEFGNSGYFYVSYDDACIEQEIIGIRNIKEIENMEYDNIYEYDEMGSNVALKVINDNKTMFLTNGYAANVFERKDKQKIEHLSEVGLFMTNTQGVEIYINAKDDNLNNCTLVGTYTGENALERGYHTLKLTSPVKLTGDKFVVKVKYINSEGAEIPIECNLYETGLISETDNIYSKVSSNPGESFYSNDGIRWSDLYNYKVFDEAILKNTNACIKAFSTVSEPVIPETVAVTGVTLNESVAELKEGETKELVASILPENATNKNITWASSDESVATIQNGVVTAKKEGTAIITVTTEDGGHTASCTITVKSNVPENIAVTGVKLNESVAELKEGQTKELIASVLPENATNKNIIWASSDESVAIIQNGIVTAKKEGTAVITVTTEDGGHTASCLVKIEPNVINIPVESIELNKTYLTIQEGDKTNLIVTILPINATNQKVMWESSNNKVATVENGIIVAISEGTTIITAKSEDGEKLSTCKVTVTKKINTDDDIYIDTGDNSNNNNNNNSGTGTVTEGDNTMASGKIPQTGIKYTVFIIATISVVGIGIVVVVKWIKYNDIK